MPSSTDVTGGGGASGVGTDTLARPVSGPGAWADAARDLAHLVRFRAGTVRRRGLAVVSLLLVAGLSVVFAVLPGHLVGAPSSGRMSEAVSSVTATLEDRLPLVLLATFGLAVASALGSGGGRELLSRSEASVHPVGPLTEHLAALALAPLNLAWLVQLWGALAVLSISVDGARLPGAVAVLVAWLVAVTASAQAVGWFVEGVRRQPRGVVVVRAGGAALAVVALVLHAGGHLGVVLDLSPARWVAEQMERGAWGPTTALLLAAALAAVVLGAVPARWALALPAREELRADSDVHRSRPAPRSRLLPPELVVLRRLDRASVWRSVGMRRGLVFLGLGPGAAALAVGMPWGSVMMLPGLAASGAALLFAVNAWCLDARGMIWRESLPVLPRVVFDARALVAGECMVAVSTLTMAMASLRAGTPTPTTAVAVLACWVVVVVQVLSVSMSWSMRRPYGVDLGSPRATPAPHAVMAGYAARLSLVTTLTGMVFASLAVADVWWVPVVVAPVFLAWSTTRLLRARRRWERAEDRALVALTVAAV